MYFCIRDTMFMIKRNCWLILFLFIILPEASAQGELEDQPQIFYRNERTIAGTLFSNGYGADIRFAKRKDAFSSFTYGGGIGIIQHPKEYKSQSPYTRDWGRSYVFGKMNEVMTIRGGIGIQKEIFSKFDRGGISVRYFYSGGLTLVLLKPVYYLKITGFKENGRIIYESSQFDPDYMQSIYDIYDRESFFVGVSKTKFRPGMYIRAGLSFEFSADELDINSLDAGVQLEGFMTKLPIMASTDNQQLLLSLFISYRFGKVIDGKN